MKESLLAFVVRSCVCVVHCSVDAYVLTWAPHWSHVSFRRLKLIQSLDPIMFPNVSESASLKNYSAVVPFGGNKAYAHVTAQTYIRQQSVCRAQMPHRSAGEHRGKCSVQAATCPHCSCIKQQTSSCSASSSLGHPLCLSLSDRSLSLWTLCSSACLCFPPHAAIDFPTFLGEVETSARDSRG